MISLPTSVTDPLPTPTATTQPNLMAPETEISYTMRDILPEQTNKPLVYTKRQYQQVLDQLQETC